MVSLKRKQQGFTIVELLIVIIVIGILAALVLVTFTGVQQKARNTERQTDIKAVASHLETYNAEKGYYPTAADLSTLTNYNGSGKSFVGDQLKGLDPASTCDPKSPSVATPPCAFATATASAATQYGYVPSPSGCDNASGNECASFVLSYFPEGGNTAVSTNSLSN